MESFSGYRQWLIVNEHQTSSRAATLVSDIRHIEEALPKTGYCGNGYTFKERPDVLRSIFKELDSIGKLDKRSQAPILSRIKNMLADVYRISVTNAKNHPPFNQLSTSRVNALKTALRLYFKFLSDFSVSLQSINSMRPEKSRFQGKQRTELSLIQNIRLKIIRGVLWG